jgi:hypothetical protein
MTDVNQANEFAAWPAFPMPWDDGTPGPTDMSFLLHRPAGSKGFVRNVNGHFGFEDGTRWRMWAVNMCLQVPLPPIELAPIVARRLAKFGVNCVRLHAIDHRWPNGILRRAAKPDRERRWGGTQDDDTRSLDPEGLARLDYFIACCAREGVYMDLNLNVARVITEADGVVEAKAVSWGKGLTYFDRQLVALQKEYAEQVLTHVNPFTGNRYADEPAIALIELVNENQLLDFWQRGLLHTGRTESKSPHWHEHPAYYTAQLDRLWNAYLAQRYPTREALAAAWKGDLRENESPALGSVRRLHKSEFAAASAERFQQEAQFYTDIEIDYFVEMKQFLRGLGAKQLLLGTSDWRHDWSSMPSIEANAELDVIDGHYYWQHPQSRTPSAHWTPDNWFIWNTPMVDQPDASVVPHCTRALVQGKPFIVSEVDEPFPNEHAAEFVPLIAAYGALQDWDGIVFYGYHGKWTSCWWTDGIGQKADWAGTFGFAQDPVKWPQVALGALMFHRGDVQAARELVGRDLPHEWVLESLRTEMPDHGHAFWMPDLPGRLALVHRTAITSFHAETLTPSGADTPLPESAIASDTGELLWMFKEGQGRVTLNAPRHQAVVGRAGAYATDHLRLTLETRFAAVQLASMEEAPIAQASRLLLVAGGRVANTGMAWDEARQSLGNNRGEAPARAEVVQGTLTLAGLVGALGVSAQPLDTRGQPMGEPIALEKTAQGWSLALGAAPTVWYAIQVAR